MSFSPIICKGAVTVDGVDRPEVMSVTFSGAADEVEIPATFGFAKSYSGGDTEWQCELQFLNGDDANALSSALFDNLGGQLPITAVLRDGAVSATNPRYDMVAVISSTGDMGGGVNSVSRGQVRLRLTGAPTKVTTGA